MKNYTFGFITSLIIIIIFSFSSKKETPTTTPVAEEVPLILKDSRSHEFYLEQAQLWKKIVSTDKTNENAWYNLFKANRFAKLTYNSIHSPEISWAKNTEWINETDYLIKGEDIVQQIEQNIPGTFMAYYLKYYNHDVHNNDFNLLEKAYQINPNFYEIYDDFVLHYEIKNDRKKRKEVNEKWFKSNDFSQNLLHYHYNVLMTLKLNSVFFSYGDNDLLAPFMLQDALGIREDVTIVNIPLMVSEIEYRSAIFKKLQIKPLNKVYEKGWSDANMKEVVDYMIANKPKELPIYFGLGLKDTLKKDFEDKLYLVGLALEYSETNIDNLAELKNNYDNKYLLDYIRIQFSSDDYEISLNPNYIHGISLLYDHYNISGDLSKAKEMSDLALSIANNIEEPYLMEFKKKCSSSFYFTEIIIFRMIDKESSDEKLVKMLQQGGISKDIQQSIDQLYVRYSNKMLEYFYYSFNKDREKAKDFVQDLFLKLIEKPNSFDVNRKFKPWIYGVASNMCKNEYRKIVTKNKYDEHIKNENIQTTDNNKFTINEALIHLKPEHKNHIILRYKFKMSIREMSEVLECPEGTVRSRLFYATKELSKHVKR